jgi:hypothetical protein
LENKEDEKKNVETIGEFETLGNFKKKNKGEEGQWARKGEVRPKGNGASHFFCGFMFFL